MSVQGVQGCRGQSVVNLLEGEELLVELEVVTRGITTPAGGEERGNVEGQSKPTEPLHPLLLVRIEDFDLLCLLLLGFVVVLGLLLFPLLLLQLHLHHIRQTVFLDHFLRRECEDLQNEETKCHKARFVSGSRLLPHHGFVSRQFPTQHDDGDLGQLAVVTSDEVILLQ